MAQNKLYKERITIDLNSPLCFCLCLHVWNKLISASKIGTGGGGGWFGLNL